MQVNEIMTRDPLSVRARGTVKEAAEGMREHGIGALPVVDERDELVGMVTDRDIAIRGVADGLGSETPVERVMTTELLFASSSDELDDVLSFMGERQVRRLPVIEERKLVGIVSQADIAAVAKPRHAAETLRSVSEPAASNAELRQGGAGLFS